jgi:hypothetical protein
MSVFGLSDPHLFSMISFYLDFFFLKALHNRKVLSVFWPPFLASFHGEAAENRLASLPAGQVFCIGSIHLSLDIVHC